MYIFLASRNFVLSASFSSSHDALKMKLSNSTFVTFSINVSSSVAFALSLLARCRKFISRGSFGSLASWTGSCSPFSSSFLNLFLMSFSYLNFSSSSDSFSNSSTGRTSFFLLFFEFVDLLFAEVAFVSLEIPSFSSLNPNVWFNFWPLRHLIWPISCLCSSSSGFFFCRFNYVFALYLEI